MKIKTKNNARPEREVYANSSGMNELAEIRWLAYE